MSEPLHIGSRRELFVDRHLIDRLEDARLHLQEPIRREVAFQIRPPLENACTGCYNLTQADERILLYYRGFYPIGEDSADLRENQTTNLLVSADGITFERPHLGLVESDGSTANNIIYRGLEAHNFCVFRDDNPEAPPEQRFKAVGGVGKDNLHGFYSADGLRWRRLQDGPLDITGAFDSVNVPLWDPHAGCYRLFSRYFEDTPDGKIRAIQSCASDDFIHWTPPQPHVYDDGLPLEHFYTNATTPCPGAEHLLLSFPMRFLPGRTKNTEGMDYPGAGLSDAVFMSSRDGVRWDRTFREAWIRPGPDPHNWSHRSLTPAPGLIETAPDEWSMYISEHYGRATNRLRRVTVRPHRFASVRAGYGGGSLLTKPVIFDGGSLRINYATSAAGAIAIEVQDHAGAPIEGFRLEDMEPMYGDAFDAPVIWRHNSDLSKYAGVPVRLRFALKDADLFALQMSKA